MGARRVQKSDGRRWGDALTAALAACGVLCACGETAALVHDVPLLEVSALDIWRGPSGDLLVCAGDRTHQLWLAPIAPDGTLGPGELLSWDGLGDGDSDVEAVVFGSGPGDIYVLSEERAEIGHLRRASDTGPLRLADHTALVVPPDHALAAGWGDKPNRRGEGLARMGDGSWLVAKQKKPAALLSFSKDGLAATWTVDPAAGVREIHDLARDGDGRLHLLVEPPEVVRLGPLPPGGGAVSVVGRWRVPEAGVGTPEGLAFDSAGRVWIGLDSKRTTANLLSFPLPPAR